MKLLVIISFTAVIAFVNGSEPEPGTLPDGPVGLPGPGHRRMKEVMKEVGKEIAKELVAEIIEKVVAYIKNEIQNSRREVNVVNELKENVWVRCRDKHINVGDRLVPLDKSYHFFFDRSFWGVTHFWCNAWYNGGARPPTHFPAYNEGAPNDNNVFVLREDGVYIKNGDSTSLFRARNNEQ